MTKRGCSGSSARLVLWHGRAIFMDWHPHIKYLSPLTKCLLLGDYEGMMDLIGEKKGDELQRLLESRETYFKVPPLFHVVRGVMARNRGESERGMQECGWGMEEKKYSYRGCFMKLLGWVQTSMPGTSLETPFSSTVCEAGVRAVQKLI